MTDWPEHDPELTPVLRTARRFLEWVKPSPDDPERPLSNERVDDLPQLRSSHIFTTWDDAVIDLKRRNDPSLGVTRVGSFDDHARELVEMNIRYRAGIFVEISAARAIVAEFDGAMARYGMGARFDMREALPIQPSITISTGHNPLTGFLQQQWVWLLSDGPLSRDDRDAIGAKICDYDAIVPPLGKHLLRVPGFFNRSGKPFQVQCQGAQEFVGLRTIVYTVEQLRNAFIPRPVEVDA